MLQTLDSEASYPASQPNFGEDHARSLNLGDYVEILKRRFFYLLFAFGLVSILGLCLASMLKPNYLSEGKILVESQIIGPDPTATAAFERVQRIQQRAMTRDNLLLIASKFGFKIDGTIGLDSRPRAYQEGRGRVADALANRSSGCVADTRSHLR